MKRLLLVGACFFAICASASAGITIELTPSHTGVVVTPEHAGTAHVFWHEFEEPAPWFEPQPKLALDPAEPFIPPAGFPSVSAVALNSSYNEIGAWAPRLLTSAIWKPAKVLTWYWQLQGTVNNAEPVAAYDIDGFENSAGEVATLHAKGIKAICYIDVGTWEEWRSDASSFPASVKGKNNGWPGEKYLDIRALSTLEPIMTKRFEMCRSKGFDAVEPDNMDTFESSTGFPLTGAEQITYDTWIAGEVHSLGMAVLQKNDGEQTSALKAHFDGALTEECNVWNECANFTPYLAEGKPVLNAEYGSSNAFCTADNAAGIMGARFDLELDGKVFAPCWEPPLKPTVVTTAATEATQTSATLNATVNPRGLEVTKCEFEYGTTNSYGSTVPCASPPGSGSSPVAVSAAITGLSANNTYHFRISATNTGGTSQGFDETFKALTSCTAEGFCTSFSHSESPEFSEPNAVAVDPSGNVWAAGSRDRVLEFNAQREYVRQFGAEGTGEGQFLGIGGIATDASGDVYVTDEGNNRVEEFSATGTYLRQFGSTGLGAGQFYGPTGIALDSTGNVWVLNTHGVKLQEFSPTGTYISGFGTSGWFTGGGSGLAFSGGNLYVTEALIGRVQEYSTSGTSLAPFDERGSGNGKSQLPLGIASDPTTGNLYVTDVGTDRVQEFSSSGGFIAAFGSAGSGAGQFSRPKGVAVGSSGLFYVADTGNNRIEEWLTSP